MKKEQSSVRYMERTRAYYEALGYETPYRWATFEEVPFCRPPRPPAELRLTLISTARRLEDEAVPEPALPPARRVFSFASADPPERLYTADLAWDKEATHTDDRECYFPVQRLAELVESGLVGSLARRFHSVPTEYSQRKTLEEDAPEILHRCLEDGVEAALLVPL